MGQDAIRTVALSGQPAHGTAPGVVFASFNYSAKHVQLNDLGQVAFTTVLKGSGVTNANSQGVWTEGRGSGLELVARGGDPAPGELGGPGLTRSFLGTALTNLQLNDAGVTAIGQHNPVFWSDAGGHALEVLALAAQAIPGVANSKFDTFPERSILNNVGRTSLPASVNNISSVVVHDPTSGYSVRFQADGQAPGSPAGVVFDPTYPPVVPLIGRGLGYETDSGRLFVVSRVAGPGVDVTNDTGLWNEDATGTLRLIVREGDAAPGLAGGPTIGSFTALANERGHVAFAANLTGAGVNSSNNFGMWVNDDAGGPQFVMRLGEHAPGTAAGINFARNAFTMQPWTFNNLGQVSFNGHLTGAGVTSANDSGM